tara:strand:+ start:960 stop:1442 length:483 start_codon:yes stop_codon:yes gene_type:complete
MSILNMNFATEEESLFYLANTIEKSNKVILNAKADISILPGEIKEIDLGVKLSVDTKTILIYPNNKLTELPIIYYNLNNVYDSNTKLKIMYLPNLETYKRLIVRGIDSFKLDILQLAKKRDSEKMMNNILSHAEPFIIKKGTKLLDVYLSDYSEFLVKIN